MKTSSMLVVVATFAVLDLPGTSHVYVDGGYVADAATGAVPPGGNFRADLGMDESTGVVAKKSKSTWQYVTTV